ncbi:MAG: hypothetical protein P8176_07830 [Gammaproteobacteria bacterium]
MKKVAKMKWLKLHNDLLDNAKLLLLDAEQCWLFVRILMLKSTGLLDSERDPQRLLKKVCLRLRINEAQAEAGRQALMQEGLIDDAWQPLGWEARQENLNKSTQRVRKHRKKKAQQKQNNPNHKSAPSKAKPKQSRAPTSSEPVCGVKQPQPKSSTPPKPKWEPEAWVNRDLWFKWQAVIEAKRGALTAEQLDVAQASLRHCVQTLNWPQDQVIEKAILHAYVAFHPLNRKGEPACNPKAARPVAATKPTISPVQQALSEAKNEWLHWVRLQKLTDTTHLRQMVQEAAERLAKLKAEYADPV